MNEQLKNIPDINKDFKELLKKSLSTLSDNVKKQTGLDETINKLLERQDMKNEDLSKFLEDLKSQVEQVKDDEKFNEEEKQALNELLTQVQEFLTKTRQELASLMQQAQGNELIEIDDMMISNSAGIKEVAFLEDPVQWIKNWINKIFVGLDNMSFFGMKVSASEKMGLDYSKVSKYFENIKFGEKQKIAGALNKIQTIPYKNFVDKMSKSINPDYNDWIPNFIEDLIDIKIKGERIALDSKEKEILANVLDFIAINSDFINNALGDNIDKANMQDVLKILFNNRFSDSIRDYAMPSKGVKIRKKSGISNYGEIPAQPSVETYDKDTTIISKGEKKEVQIGDKKIMGELDNNGKVFFTVGGNKFSFDSVSSIPISFLPIQKIIVSKENVVFKLSLMDDKVFDIKLFDEIYKKLMAGNTKFQIDGKSLEFSKVA